MDTALVAELDTGIGWMIVDIVGADVTVLLKCECIIYTSKS